MHELEVTKAIIKVAEEECLANDIRAREIKIRLGTLTSYKSEPIRYYYDLLKTGSESLADSVLEFEGYEGDQVKVVRIRGE